MPTYAASQNHKGYEVPSYALESKDGAFELRRYAPHIVASVAVNGTRQKAVGRGFRMLARYIFGGNATGEKIKMTAPVAQAPRDANSWEITFTMPSRYKLDTLPKAKQDSIRFYEAPVSRQAVVVFTGRWGAARLQEEEVRLADWIRSSGLTVTSEPRYYFYDDPMTLPWRRRNEIARLVES